ncbi:IclR family transcriptional regulator C-terminal domain-containing protein [Streptomyces sp. NBC_01006]|uniref:IclR family transcriptional regulator domain-containing protein n=1 Tax=Streptomyces sp. NBC_01006 TaxID=2903716 RepID=UPI003866B74E
MALRHGTALTYIRKIESGRSFRSPARIGARAALHSTAIGRSVLAHLPPDEAEALLRAAGTPAPAPCPPARTRACDGGRGGSPSGPPRPPSLLCFPVGRAPVGPP